MELSRFNTRKGAEQGYDLTLVDLNGARTDIVITLLGADSKTYQDKLREHQRRRLSMISRTRRLTQSPEELDSEALELTVAATTGWIGMEMNGAEFPYSEENARSLYSDYPAIREQVDVAINERANFLPRDAIS